MADPDIRRMGKKHKKHKKDHAQYSSYHLPSFLPERVPKPEEPQEMKVVLRLPRPMENHNGRLRFTPSSSQYRHDHRHSANSHHAPRELLVSIPLTALYPPEEPEEEEEEVVPIPVEPIPSEHHHHHKHKKHKKHKKQHHHESATATSHADGIKGHHQSHYNVGTLYHQHHKPAPPPSLPTPSPSTLAPLSTPAKSAMTVAPLRIQVPKSSDSKSLSSSKHKTHSHHERSGSAERHGSRTKHPVGDGAHGHPPVVMPSGKHMHTHKHHHKHKEKKQHDHSHHHHHKVSHHQGSESHHASDGGGSGGGDYETNEQGQRGNSGSVVTPRLPVGRGKPTAFLVNEERKAKVGDVFSAGEKQAQHGSHDGHKHHKKKKKKHHKHSKHSLGQSETEISPTVPRLSDMETESGHGFLTTTPLSTGISKSVGAHTPATVQAVSPQDTHVPVHAPSGDSSVPLMPLKEGRRLSQDTPGVSQTSLREARRPSQDYSLGRLSMRRLSQDTKSPKLKLPESQPPPPPPKRAKMEAASSSSRISPLLSTKMDISLTRTLESELKLSETPSPPPVNNNSATSFQSSLSSSSSSLRQPSSHLPAEPALSTNTSTAAAVSTPVSKENAETRRPSVGEKTYSSKAPPSPQPNLAEVKTPQVRLSKDTLQLFLKNLHHLIQRRDPDGIFAEPVTDDIAPGYSALISIPMDLATMATKIEMGQYSSVSEFKSDFILMCNNAMTYNAPETVYYGSAKRLLTTGLQIIVKETSLRPDIRHGTTALIPSRSVSPAPISSDHRIPTPPINIKVDYSSPFLCRLDLSVIRGAVTSSVGTSIMGVSLLGDQSDHIHVDVGEVADIPNQSHLTKIVIGVEGEELQDEKEEDILTSVTRPESPEEILMQVEEAAEAMKENLDANRPHVKFTFLNQDDSGKTMLNILNPDTGSVDVSSPLDLSSLGDYVRMGNNAATVLKTELPLMRATPVSYLMYGPFGSFAPAYDSSFATLTKMDSDLLLQSYGSELGVSYAHSLQQFVKGAGSFVTEMADAVLNGLTNNRHSKFMSKFKAFEEKERKLREGPSSSSRKESKDEVKKRSPSQERESSTPASEKEESRQSSKEDDKNVKEEEHMDTSEPSPMMEGNSTATAISDGNGDGGGPTGSGESRQQDLMTDKGSKGLALGTAGWSSNEQEKVTSIESENTDFNTVSEESSNGSCNGRGDGIILRRKPQFSSLSREASSDASDQVSGSRSGTPGQAELRHIGAGDGEGGGERDRGITEGSTLLSEVAEGEGAGTNRDSLGIGVSGHGDTTMDIVSSHAPLDEGFDDVDEAILANLDEIGSLSSSDSGGSATASGATSETNSRATSPGQVETLESLSLQYTHPQESDIDSQLAHTTQLLDELHDHQRDRLSQAPLELSDGHLVLPGPTDEEVKIASHLRAGLAQLTAQARPRDIVSVPALHDAMGISMETVTEMDARVTQAAKEETLTPISQTLVPKSEHRESSDQH